MWSQREERCSDESEGEKDDIDGELHCDNQCFPVIFRRAVASQPCISDIQHTELLILISGHLQHYMAICQILFARKMDIISLVDASEAS